jgi:hypothetical protein
MQAVGRAASCELPGSRSSHFACERARFDKLGVLLASVCAGSVGRFCSGAVLWTSCSAPTPALPAPGPSGLWAVSGVAYL